MTHPLVAQLRFTRSEFKRGLVGLTEAEACRRFLPLNCISWSVGHLAWQEQRYFLFFAQNQMLLPQINAQFATGAPASTPSLPEMWTVWDKITRVVDPWLEAVTIESLRDHVVIDGQSTPYIFGSLLQRVIYHYWYHMGENLAIRQMLGHTNLPVFVGDIDGEAPYRTE